MRSRLGWSRAAKTASQLAKTDKLPKVRYRGCDVSALPSCYNWVRVNTLFFAPTSGGIRPRSRSPFGTSAQSCLDEAQNSGYVFSTDANPRVVRRWRSRSSRSSFISHHLLTYRGTCDVHAWTCTSSATITDVSPAEPVRQCSHPISSMFCWTPAEHRDQRRAEAWCSIRSIMTSARTHLERGAYGPLHA